MCIYIYIYICIYTHIHTHICVGKSRIGATVDRSAPGAAPDRAARPLFFEALAQDAKASIGMYIYIYIYIYILSLSVYINK